MIYYILLPSNKENSAALQNAMPQRTRKYSTVRCFQNTQFQTWFSVKQQKASLNSYSVVYICTKYYRLISVYYNLIKSLKNYHDSV